MKGRFLLFVALSCGVLATAQTRVATSYGIAAEGFGGGGAPATSANYGHRGSVGLISGQSTSAAYRLEAGFLAQAGSAPDGPEISVFDGAAVSPAAERQSAGSFRFAVTPAGNSSSPQSFTLKNTGTTDLTGLTVTKVGIHPDDFAIGSLGVSTLAPDATATLTVTFSPSVSGPRTAVLQIASNDPDESPFTITLWGNDVVTATYAAGTDVPLTVTSYTATGGTVNLALNFAPAVGTQLMVVNNTGRSFIAGRFDNLAHGQSVALSYSGTTYYFVADYYGGSGNDLVLAWAATRVFATGQNANGQLGDTTTTTRYSPVLVTSTGALAGKTVRVLARGAAHSLALCSDGTLVAWGKNSEGQLGDGTSVQRTVPVAVTTAGTPLAGRTVVAIAAGDSHSLALCSDGTVVAWGYNAGGQLGDGSLDSRLLPVAVTMAGTALAGKSVVALAAGRHHSLALSDDGTVAAWGLNFYGELGDGTTTDRRLPVAVTTAGTALAGKTVVTIAAGAYHSLALCSDRTLAAWGDCTNGQIGNGAGGGQFNTAVAVITGVPALAGKTIVALAAGARHSLALCSDGTVAAWGDNTYGQLGHGSSGQSVSPLASSVSAQPGVSALFGKVVTHIAAGFSHSFAVCSDGTLAAWGNNPTGQLGDNSNAPRTFPVAVNAGALVAGEKFIRTGGSGDHADHSLALVASPPLPEITLFNGGNALPEAEILHGSGSVSFPLTQTNVSSLAQIVTIKNTGTANLTGLSVAKIGDHAGDFTLGSLGANTLVPGATTTFSLTFTPTAEGTRNATVQIASNDADENPFSFAATGTSSTVAFTYGSAGQVALTTSGFTATGKTANIALNFAPQPGAQLMVVRNSGAGFITGNFTNLAHGQAVVLSYGGVSYNFVANYYGGSGNDLVLVWALSQPASWGANGSGQLGDTTTTSRSLPGAVASTFGLAGKTVVALASGQAHSLALCSDGTLLAWGDNTYGQLGDGTTMARFAPTAVIVAGTPLAGKTVVSVKAGFYHSLALCSDGTVATWGYNSHGQLGDGTTTNRTTPGAVFSTGALAGKTVVSVAGGSLFSVALCSDGTLRTWGYNANGQLGNNGGNHSSVPVAVVTTGALNGKTVTSMVVGVNHTLALCSDGTLVAWGFNFAGQLGDGTAGSDATRYAPVAVTTTGALAGKIVVTMAAGEHHSLALCSDGTLVSWGQNSSGQLGFIGSNFPVPWLVTTTGTALVGRTAIALAAGTSHSFALLDNGTLAAWGKNNVGQLGDGTTTQRNNAVLAGAAIIASGGGFGGVFSGLNSEHSLALIGTPLPGEIAVFDGSGIGGVERTSNTGSAVFADTPTGTSSNARTFTILNAGTGSLTGLAVTKSGSHPDDFIISGLGSSILAPGATTTFTVTFAPGAGGERLAALHIASNDADENPFVVSVSGTAIAPVVEPLGAAFTAATDVPVTAATYDATGREIVISLHFTPTVGTELLVVRHTGLSFITGAFVNLAQGQVVRLNYAGTDYDFVANYFGGTGNDLVLAWADVRSSTWGSNNQGQLGDGTTTNRTIPGPVTSTGVLAGRTVLAQAIGQTHSLALCSDGTLVAWGQNNFGQLGDGTTTSRAEPVIVPTAGTPLAGRTVVAVATGAAHSLALCADGTVAAWGQNNFGQLGDGTNTHRFVPTALTTAGTPLSGKSIVSVTAGYVFSLALCSDGTVAAWGYNLNGQLGNGTGTNSLVPVAVTTSGVLGSKTVLSLAAGVNHTLAVCSDGTLATWGFNFAGELGDNSTNTRFSPIAVLQNSGSALFGKTVIAAAAGEHHSLALCSDGTLVSWGQNSSGQLGHGNTLDQRTPVAVVPTGTPLAGRTVVRLAAGTSHSLALCTDGTLVAWGKNSFGQLGDGTTTQRTLAVAVSTAALASGERFIRMSGGSYAEHAIALIAAPPLSALAAWRQLHFGSAANTGGAANVADPDADGISNLLEYALGLDPLFANSSGLPVATVSENEWVFTFTRATAAADVSCVVEFSTNLATWSSDGITLEAITTAAESITWQARYPRASAPMLFFRLRTEVP